MEAHLRQGARARVRDTPRTHAPARLGRPDPRSSAREATGEAERRARGQGPATGGQALLRPPANRAASSSPVVASKVTSPLGLPRAGPACPSATRVSKQAVLTPPGLQAPSSSPRLPRVPPRPSGGNSRLDSRPRLATSGAWTAAEAAAMRPLRGLRRGARPCFARLPSEPRPPRPSSPPRSPRPSACLALALPALLLPASPRPC